jgi:hypothetical protein
LLCNQSQPRLASHHAAPRHPLPYFCTFVRYLVYLFFVMRFPLSLPSHPQKRIYLFIYFNPTRHRPHLYFPLSSPPPHLSSAAAPRARIPAAHLFIYFVRYLKQKNFSNSLSNVYNPPPL